MRIHVLAPYTRSGKDKGFYFVGITLYALKAQTLVFSGNVEWNEKTFPQ